MKTRRFKKHLLVLPITFVSAITPILVIACKGTNENKKEKTLEINEELNKLKVTIKETSKNKTKESLNIDDFNFSKISDKYQIVNFKIENYEVDRLTLSLQLKDKKTQTYSKKRTISLFDNRNFMNPIEQLNSEIKSVLPAFNGDITKKYIGDVTIDNFTFVRYDKDKYELVNKSINKKTNGTVSISFQLQDKATKELSNLRSNTIDGFITKETLINKLNNELSRITITPNVTPSETFITDINQSNFTIGEYDSGQYTLDVISFTKNNDSVSFVVRLENKKYNLLSETRNIVINGFKREIQYQEKLNNVLNLSSLNYNGDKVSLIASDIDLSKIELVENPNIDRNVYHLSNVELVSTSNQTARIQYRIIDTARNLLSDPKTFELDGFLDTETLSKPLIQYYLKNVRIIASNNGYFKNNNDEITITSSSLNPILENIKYQWFKDDLPIYNQNTNKLSVNKNQIVNDSNFHLQLSTIFNDEEIIVKTPTVEIHKNNPLSSINLNSSANGLIVDNNNTLSLQNATINNISKIDWYKNNELFASNNLDNLETSQPGEYYALLTDDNGVEWSTNVIHVSDKKLLNNDQEFAKKLTNELNLQSFSSKILSYHERTGNKQYYVTDLETKYGQYGFRYPGYDNNYESNGNKRRSDYIDNGKQLDYLNSWLKYQENGETKFVNISDLVLAEKTPDNTDYADPNWIKKQIQLGELKVHPAVKNFYERNVLDTTQAVVKNIQIASNILGFNSTGIYIPAGEIATIQFDDNTYNLLKENYANNNDFLPFQFVINENYWDNRPFNNSGRISNRYPRIQSNFTYRFNEIDPETKKLKIATPFGGSLSISLNSHLYNKDGSFHTVNLSIDGGVEQLFYVYKQTDLENWNTQIGKVKSGEISSPVFAIQTDYSSILIPFTAPTTIAGVNIDHAIFPEYNFRKWDSFYQMSYAWGNYGASKVVLNYCNDVWGGAGAWGGNGYLYADTSWASSYISGKSEFSFDNWGNYHEINHNFQDYQDPFNIRDHGWTNIPSIIDISFVNDESRKRNLINTSGRWTWGWARLANAFNLTKTGKDWYSLYSFLIYTLGPDKFMQWVQSSGRSGHHWSNTATVKYLSDYFDLNFYYALRTYTDLLKHSSNFRRDVPKFGNDFEKETTLNAIKAFNQATENYENANKALQDAKDKIQIEKDKIQADKTLSILEKVEKNLELTAQLSDYAEAQKDALNKLSEAKEALRIADLDYPKDPKVVENIESMQEKMGIDFVGNLYAIGNYLYNPKNNSFEYSSDVQAPFQIPAYEDYTFDFEKGIASVNSNFTWSKMTFEPTTKWFGTLKVDPTNPKKLIYHANENYLNQIDEFDLTIYPDNFEGKPSNYVPAYKFKIKIRNVVNKPTFYIYNNLTNFTGNNIDQAIQYAKDNNVEALKIVQDFHFNNGSNNYLNAEKRLIKSHFKFIPPVSGNYEIRGQVDDHFKMFVNGESVITKNQWIEYAQNLSTIYFDANQVYDIEIYGYNSSGAGGLNVWLFNDNKHYQFDDYALTENFDTTGKTIEELRSILNNPEYQYKPRFIDSNDRFTSQINKYIPSKRSKTRYTISSDDQIDQAELNKLLNTNVNDVLYIEDANEATFKFTLDQASLINKMSITRVVDKTKITDDDFEDEPENHENESVPVVHKDKEEKEDTEFVPTHYIVYGEDVNGEKTKLLDYYLTDNKVPAIFDLNFINSKVVKNLYLTVSKPTNGLKLVNVQFSLAINTNKILPINSEKIKFFGNWKLENNQTNIGSVVNNIALTSNTSSDYLTTTINTNSFAIVGKEDLNSSSFDVYLDDELIGSNVTTSSDTRKLNALIFSYNSPKPDNKPHILKIVNKEDKLLVLNYIPYLSK
ncbi:hypothetical protein H9M94_00665 [Mycoplasma sp. Pen4]|uniref:PA14 domain-containing protein n=1 Tax=Mycoplasma sp. Pen4 TaxID=640330 RepID=UPI001654AF0F|nr:PA14 domain-containing protein [Mycoplasma sp. Pen4]QNM93776.1 hypothetical protein H9M94_00665 [Mycoplasma sp. Pen4]